MRTEETNILGIHGLYSDGTSNIDVLLHHLDKLNYITQDVQTPKIGPFRARFRAERDGKIIADCSKDGDILVAHSYGCLAAAHAMEHITYQAVYMFRPAMPKQWKFPEHSNVICVHSTQDWAILFGSILFFHPFGVAGRVGFEDPEVFNIRSYGGHNEDFNRPAFWAGYISRRTQRMLYDPGGTQLQTDGT